MTTYSIAYMNDLLIAIVPFDADIQAAIEDESKKIGEDLSDCTIVHGVTLCDETEPDDDMVFASPSGACGWLSVKENGAERIYKYAVKRS
jgi:hypothetical protein